MVPRASLMVAMALGFAVVASSAWADSAAREVEAPATSSWDVVDAVATISLDRSTLSGLGLEIVALEPSISRHVPHPLSVAPASAPSFASQQAISLRAAVATDGFHGFEGGSFRSRGGFMLRLGGESLDFSSFELRPAAKATALELLDANGVAQFITADAQWEFDAEAGLLRYLNADLRIMPDLARRLGDDRYATVTVGVLAFDVSLRVGTMPPPPEPLAAGAPPPCGDWSGVVDVALSNMSNIGQAGIAVVNGRSVVVVLPSADLRNVGTANVPWYSKFTNLGVPPWNDQHPFLVWQMTRSKVDGVFEPLGRSDLKHAFLTLNTGCDAGACTDSHVLGLGCSDVYSTGTNNSVGSLAPRGEVTASTGIWAHCGGIPSHFDTNGDCVQDFSGSGENAFTHGLKAAEADLQGIAGAKYYVEAFYIIRNDTNIFNSMGYREVAPAKPGSTWTFPTVGGYLQGPPINAWVNPTVPGPNADNRVLDTGGQGRVQLAMRATDVAGEPGRKRFAYALQNHDFDRRIKSFRIPFDTTAGTVTNIAYADGDGFAVNDWTSAVDATGITWTAPAATTPPAEIDYASLVSFRFDFNGTAGAASATLGVFEAGSPTELQVQTLAPPGNVVAPPGSFFAVTPCRLVDTRAADGPNAGPALVSGVARTFAARGQCGIPATAVAVALNVTAIQPASSGHVDVFFGAAPTTSTLNYNAGQTRANNLVSGLDVDGNFKLMAVQPAGTLQVVVDVSGYFD